MSRSTLAAVAVSVAALAVPAVASAVNPGHPLENRGGYVSIRQARHDATMLAVRTARRTEARRVEVTGCRHLRQSSVECAVRLVYRDPEDGFVSVVRYVSRTLATFGGRWSDLRLAPQYETGLIYPS